jgi:hypothetical protein
MKEMNRRSFIWILGLASFILFQSCSKEPSMKLASTEEEMVNRSALIPEPKVWLGYSVHLMSLFDSAYFQLEDNFRIQPSGWVDVEKSLSWKDLASEEKEHFNTLLNSSYPDIAEHWGIPKTDLRLREFLVSSDGSLYCLGIRFLVADGTERSLAYLWNPSLKSAPDGWICVGGGCDFTRTDDCVDRRLRNAWICGCLGGDEISPNPSLCQWQQQP